MPKMVSNACGSGYSSVYSGEQASQGDIQRQNIGVVALERVDLASSQPHRCTDRRCDKRALGSCDEFIFIVFTSSCPGNGMYSQRARNISNPRRATVLQLGLYLRNPCVGLTQYPTSTPRGGRSLGGQVSKQVGAYAFWMVALEVLTGPIGT